MKFDKAQYLREVFANKIKVHKPNIRKVRVLSDGVYFESGKDRGVFPQEAINQWALDMWS